MDGLEKAGGAAARTQRKRKLASLREAGFRYPNDFAPTHQAAGLPAIEAEGPDAAEVRVAGRIMLLRDMGKSAFATLQDATGRIQLYAAAGDGSAQSCLDGLLAADLGDIVGASGRLFRTRRGELTVELTGLHLLAKCLRPLPDKHKGLVSPEQRVRKRHLALLTDRSERDRVIARARLVRALRAFFDERGYVEAETPMMHPIPGGAVARPFVTDHQALDMQLYLRIAPELYLKRLLVGGFEKVYELNRSFRNEGVSSQHNPEFSMLEFYAAYRRHADFMELTEELFGTLAENFAPSGKLKWRGHEISMAGPWPRIALADAVAERNDLRPEQVVDPELLAAKLAGFGGAKADRAEESDLGTLQALLFEKTVEESLVAPTFVTDFPASVSPLARRSDSKPEVAERFELFIGGREFANGFSELNDPQLQAEVFRVQAARAAAGDREAMRFDADYIAALEAGMPPAAGEGIGVDRLAMLMLGCDSIREVIMFPLVRHAAAQDREAD